MLNIEQPGDYRIALLHLGFRPFFLLAGVHAVFAIGLWTWFFLGYSPIQPMGLAPAQWHAHEMVYGYAMAVIAGFLLTAVRNWSGVQTVHGAALLLLVSLWLAARVLALIPGALLPMAVMDLGFNLGLVAAVFYPVLRARRWKQVPLLTLPLVMAALHGVFYLGVLGGWPPGATLGVYGGLYLVVMLILVMGRRVIPFFIEKGVGSPALLRNRAWVDVATLVLMPAFIVVELSAAWPAAAGTLALALALLQGVRLADWHHRGIWRRPLLWSLYLALAWIAFGFALRALALVMPFDPFAALHAFAFGGIGLVTLSMMCRVSLGHTGRNVFEPPRSVQWMLGLVVLGALARVLGPLLLPSLHVIWIVASQALWIAGFGLFVAVYAPMLVRPRADGRYG